MNKIYKYIGVILLTVFTLTSTSCNDFLTQDAKHKTTDDGGATEGEVFSLYGKLRGYDVTSGIPAFAVHCFRSEDSEKGSSATDGPEQVKYFDNFEYTMDNGVVKGYWNSNLEIATKASSVIADIDSIILSGEYKDIDVVNKAEAHFFRAYVYFNMVRAFGEVPIIDFKIKKPGDVNVPKSSIEKVYKLIDEDLTYATAKLPPTWPAEYLGRLTKGAARSLHARTYMMRNDWGNMNTAATEVINSGLYSLETTSDMIFTDYGELSKESIFELVCTSTMAKPEDSGIGSQYAQVQGVRGSGDWNLGWGWHMATKELGEAFEAGDPRKDATLLYFRKSESEPAIKNEPYGEVVLSPEGMGAYYNKKVYTDPAKRAKYSNAGFWVNIRLIRYADVLLMGAESANELGDTTNALKYLEEVRSRARRTNPNALPEVTETDQEKLRQAIRHERRVELALEFDRFYDLVRWGVAEKVLHDAGKTGYQDRNKYLPVPQDEIDKSNNVLVQNPLYP